MRVTKSFLDPFSQYAYSRIPALQKEGTLSGSFSLTVGTKG